MAVKKATDAVVNVTSGINSLVKVHRATFIQEERVFDVTGDAEVNTVVAFGEKQIQLRLEASIDGTALPISGTTVNVVLDTNSGSTYDEDYKVVSAVWDTDRRGGGPPQRAIIMLTPHEEGLSNSAVTSGMWG